MKTDKTGFWTVDSDALGKEFALVRNDGTREVLLSQSLPRGFECFLIATYDGTSVVAVGEKVYIPVSAWREVSSEAKWGDAINEIEKNVLSSFDAAQREEG